MNEKTHTQQQLQITEVKKTYKEALISKIMAKI